MKPSKRIQEIVDHYESMRSDQFAALLKTRYRTANFRIAAVMQYLDEEYERDEKSRADLRSKLVPMDGLPPKDTE